MSDIDVLQGVLDKLEGVVVGVRPDQLDDPTDCPDFTVAMLVDHIATFMQSFAAAAQGRTPDGGPGAAVSDDPVKDVRLAAEQIVSGWREHGTDRKVAVMGPGMPGEMVLGMTIMEYVTHGCDLAMATGQAIPFSDDELGVALARAEASLTDDARGDSFGPRIPVPDQAPVVDRFLGFMGRRAPATA
jgi:uncharacterized protein (TIGR03086 family)